jgi:hypothetical protein
MYDDPQSTSDTAMAYLGAVAIFALIAAVVMLLLSII